MNWNAMNRWAIVTVCAAVVMVWAVAPGLCAEAAPGEKAPDEKAQPASDKTPPGGEGAAQEGKAFADALDGALAGKVPLEKVTIFANHSAQKIQYTVYGRGFAFADGKQYPLSKEQVQGILKRLQKANFATLPRMVGTPPPGAGGPAVGPGVGPRVRSHAIIINADLRVSIGEAEKQVGQIRDNQSPMLLALITDIQKDIQAGKDKAIDLAKLSLQDALKKLAKGELALEALSVRVNCFPSDAEVKPFNFQLVRGYMVINNKPADKLHQDPAAMQKAVADMAKIFSAVDATKIPKDLYAKGQVIGFSVSVEGCKQTLYVSARGDHVIDPAQDDAQKAFDKMMEQLQKLGEDLQAPPKKEPDAEK